MGLGVTLRINERGVAYHHRWERLCLIECAGRAEQEAEARAESGKGRVRKQCRDCLKAHTELFEIDAEEGFEWVVEIVERWMRWVQSLSV